MSDFRCPRYWWDGSQWRCQNLPNDYLSSYDFDTYCTNKNRCLECPYMDSEVREKVAAYKKEIAERVEEHVEEQRREYEAEQRNKENDYSYGENNNTSSTTSYSYGENNNTSSTTAYSSNGSSDSGCLSAIFVLLWGIISFVFLVILPFVFVYFIIPFYLSVSWIGILSYFFEVLFSSIGLIPLAFAFVFVPVLILYAFLPYYIMAIIVKIKTKCSKKEFLKLFWKWFLKGPFAYKDIKNFKKGLKNK